MAAQYRETALELGYVQNLPSLDQIENRFTVAFRNVQLPGEELRYGTTLTEGLWFWKRVLGSVFPRLPDNKLTKLTDELYERFSRASAWKIYPEARRILGKLKSMDVTLGLLSNFDARGPELLENLQLAQFFDGIVFSSQVGFEKPDRRIFERILDRLGPDPDRIAMVGNSVPVDLRTPESMGWETILHKPGSKDSWSSEISSWEGILGHFSVDHSV